MILDTNTNKIIRSNPSTLQVLIKVLHRWDACEKKIAHIRMLSLISSFYPIDTKMLFSKDKRMQHNLLVSKKPEDK